MGILGQAIDLGGLTFGEEHVTLGCGLAAAHQLQELGAFKRHALFKRQARGRFNTGKVGIRGIKALPLAGVGGLQLFDGTDVAGNRAVARGAWPLGDGALGKDDGVCGKTIFTRERINKAHFLSFSCGKRIT